MNIIKQILEVCESITDNRSIKDSFIYLLSEIGELATEINIEHGTSSKQKGKDGIIGEAIDSIICLVDIIYQYNPDITEEELQIIVNSKLYKWKETSK